VLRSAEAHGLVASDYGAEAIAGAIASEDQLDESTERLAQLDVDVTTNLLALGHDVALGRVNPREIDPRWKKQRTHPDFVALLDQATAGDLDVWLSSVQPKHPEYGALQKELTAIRAQGASPTDDRSRLLALNLEVALAARRPRTATHPGETCRHFIWLSGRVAARPST
jgi:murein L,D-transpeptidase YcbB/YkuD